MAAPTDVLICGAAGTGLDALECLEALNDHGARYRICGFLDDRLRGTTVAGYPVVGGLGDANTWPHARLVDALGSPRTFHDRAASIATTGASTVESFLTLIHPGATISRRATVGPGSLVLANVTIGPNARLGAHVTVLPGSVISHDASIGDWSTIASGVILSGRVRVGRGCYLGAGAAVIQDGEVGEGALVGMGSVVIRPVAPGETVAGNPARRLRSV